MLSRERVISVINHEKPDRIPVYGWVRANLSDQISEIYGSVDAFEDKYEFDFAHIFGGPSPYPGEKLRELREASGGPILPEALMEVEMNDPNETDAYQSIADLIRHHKEERGRFVYVQTPGLFECLNGVFGIENHLANLVLYEDALHKVYERQAQWSQAFANNCIDLGIDMVHISDDWGTQVGPMFNPELWWRLIHPYHKRTCEAVKARGAYVSLHCDGNFNALIDGIIDLGFDVIHPWQESAGMSLQDYKTNYADRFAVMGGIDVQTTIGFGKLDFLRSEIERVMGMFADGGLLYCTTHFIQNHCTMEELTFAFDTIYKLARSK